MIKHLVIFLFIVIAALAVFSETALARGYSPVQGRFLQRDPINSTHRIGALHQPLIHPARKTYLNLYTYVSNKPTMFIDPSGMQKKGLLWQKKIQADTNFEKVHRAAYNLKDKCCDVKQFVIIDRGDESSRPIWNTPGIHKAKATRQVEFHVILHDKPTSHDGCCQIVQFIRGSSTKTVGGKTVNSPPPNIEGKLNPQIYTRDGISYKSLETGSSIYLDRLPDNIKYLVTIDKPGIYYGQVTDLPRAFYFEFQTAVLDICRGRKTVAGPKEWGISGYMEYASAMKKDDLILSGTVMWGADRQK